MPRTAPEFGGRTHGRRVYPLRIQNENAGLLAISPAAFTKQNIISGATAGNTINSTLQSPIQGNQVMPVLPGALGGSYFVLKEAGVAGVPFVPVRLSDIPGAVANPEDVANASAYVNIGELPLGVVMHDLAGSRYDGVGGPDTDLTANYYDGSGAYLDVFVYETNARNQYAAGSDPIGQSTVYNHSGSALVYSKGDKLFVDAISGLLTNVLPVSLIDPAAVTAGVGATPVFDGTFAATMFRSYGEFGFRPARVINAIIPVPVAEVIDIPTAEYPALRIRTLL